MKRKYKKNCIVMVFGVFDIIHPGHIFFLEQAKKLGSKLIAVVARDVRVKLQKGITPVLQEKDRLLVMKSLYMVDKVILGDTDIYKPTVIRKIQPDVIAIGYDQDERHPMLLAQLSKLKKHPKVVRIKAFYPDMYSSTQFKKRV